MTDREPKRPSGKQIHGRRIGRAKKPPAKQDPGPEENDEQKKARLLRLRHAGAGFGYEPEAKAEPRVPAEEPPPRGPRARGPRPRGGDAPPPARQRSPRRPKPAAPPPSSGKFKIVGVTPESEEKPRPSGLFGRITGKLKDAIQHATEGEAPHEEAAPERRSEPPPARPAPAAAASTGVAGMAGIQKREVTLDPVVLQVGAGQAKKARQVLVRKMIREVEIDGDRLEFKCPSNRFTSTLKAMLDAKVELWFLERSRGEPLDLMMGRSKPT